MSHHRSEQDWVQLVHTEFDAAQYFFAQDVAQKGLAQHPDSLALKHLRALSLAQVCALEEAKALIAPLVERISIETEGRKNFEEILGLLGRLHKSSWRETGSAEELELARDVYLRTFRQTQGGFSGVNAASMTWLCGDSSSAQDLARQVLALVKFGTSEQESDYWTLVTIGEALLLLERDEEAEHAYLQAAPLAAKKRRHLTASYCQLRDLESHGLRVPETIMKALQPQNLISFLIPSPSEQTLTDAARKNIAEQVRDLTPAIGYTSATSEAELLFIEEMSKLGNEVNLVLPFDQSDVLDQRIKPSGSERVEKFKQALRISKTSYSVKEKYLGDETLYTFCSQVLSGVSQAHARHLNTRVTWLGLEDDKIELSYQEPSFPSLKSRESGRVIKALLFADLKNFSQLTDEHVHDFMGFFRKVARSLERVNPQPDYIRTCGDSVFCVMDRASDLVEYALELQRAVPTARDDYPSLAGLLMPRIALHAGPVYEVQDPLTRLPSYYGTDVNRTARMEPVTVPGHIYASEQFVALLEVETPGSQRPKGLHCEYIGSLDLAKNYGIQRVYHLRRAAT